MSLYVKKQEAKFNWLFLNRNYMKYIRMTSLEYEVELWSNILIFKIYITIYKTYINF